MKHTKRTVVLLVALMLICSVCLTLTACHKDKNTLDPESRPFTMSITNPDGVFNPFFSTSSVDSEIIGMTQIGMINTDSEGKPVVGENEPTVVKDYEIIENSAESTSTYRFLIKNGIKWSNGSDLTIKDVLFNLYVYLDPVYTGSATIYSTDIVGLQQYRQQDLNAGSSTGATAFESRFVGDANQRIDEGIQYIKNNNRFTDAEDKTADPGIDDDYMWDFAYVAKVFYEELTNDWKAINLEDYKTFNAKWQIFMVTDGQDSKYYKRAYENGPYVKDNEGNVLLDEEYANTQFDTVFGPYLKTKNLATENGNGTYSLVSGKDEEIDKILGEYCVKLAFENQFTTYFPMESIVAKTANRFTLTDDEKADLADAINWIDVDRYETVIRYWGTATTVFDKFTADAKTDYYSKHEKIVPNIPGITVESNVTSFKNQQLSAGHDVLCIKINGIDPKAIFNFGFNVAPMWYYSGTYGGKNYIESFDYDAGEIGLKFGDVNFMNEVINSNDKIRLPMGGGPYMASADNGKNVSADTFFEDNVVYYERNPYFDTTGEQISNAKIKYVRYKVFESDQIVNALTTGNIDFGEPSAKVENKNLLVSKGLVVETPQTNGYGYVGINPRFVPDVNVRRAIIKALNVVQLKNDYYKGQFAEVINRPMTMASWAYPNGATKYASGTATDAEGNIISIGQSGVFYEYYEGVKAEIEQMIKDAGYTKNSDGVYERNISNFGKDTLNYKFTIAGSSVDHPAYSMFLQAEKLLNSIGWQVKVVTSQQALSDLSSGKLAVWAAAWSSSVDPDMYQVYHMESQASSTKNWGYTQILGRTSNAAWGDEYEVVEALSKIIDLARSTNNQDERKAWYAKALDLVMEMAVECPTYQRKDLVAYQSNLIDPSTVPHGDNVKPYRGVLSRIWEVNYIK